MKTHLGLTLYIYYIFFILFSMPALSLHGPLLLKTYTTYSAPKYDRIKKLLNHLSNISNILFDNSISVNKSEFNDAIKYYDFSKNKAYKRFVASKLFKDLRANKFEDDSVITQSLLYEYFFGTLFCGIPAAPFNPVTFVYVKVNLKIHTSFQSQL